MYGYEYTLYNSRDHHNRPLLHILRPGGDGDTGNAASARRSWRMVAWITVHAWACLRGAAAGGTLRSQASGLPRRLAK